MTTTHRRLWLTAGWLAIGYVVVTFAGAGLFSIGGVTLGERSSKVADALVNSSMTKSFAGDYVGLVALLIFFVGAMLMARLLRGEGEVGGWLASCMGGSAVGYAAVQLAAGAASAAAVYNAHHGAALQTVTVVHDINNVGFSLSGALAGVFVLAASAAGQTARLLPRWFVVVGYLVGLILIAAVPAVRAGAPQTMAWFAWLVVFGVIAVGRARREDDVAAPAAATVSV